MPTNNNSLSTMLDADSRKHIRHRSWRMFKNTVAQYGVGFGGVSVIFAILLIFFYLLYVVLPLFVPASIDSIKHYSVSSQADATTVSDSVDDSLVYLSMEEQNEIGVRFSARARAVFFKTDNGAVISEFPLAIPENVEVTSFSATNPVHGLFAYGLSNGAALIGKLYYNITYPNDVRLITPEIKYPYGKEPVVVDVEANAILKLAIQDAEDEMTIVAINSQHQLLLSHYSKEESMLDDEVTLEQSQSRIDDFDADADYLMLSVDQSNLFVSDKNGQLSHYDVSDKESINLIQRLSIVTADRELTSLTFLTGDISLLAGDSKGTITQWFPVRNERNDQVLTPIRQFQLGEQAITAINSEQRRKGFVAADQTGQIGIFHSTAERKLLSQQVEMAALGTIALSPRANAILAYDENGLFHYLSVENEHPEISWYTLWDKVWYESYEKPEHVWQSSSADNDFEPKFSLTPLVFGTLKAAFYAMLFAIPLAILGAIYTAYFMAPRMRQIVKPSIETMEALPTVILGFLAGLLLAPLIEENLPGIFSLLIILPIGVLVVAYCWHRMPTQLQRFVPDGWTAALLIPVVLFLGWLSFALSHPLELLLFNGDMRTWLSVDLGIDFDQRNSIVVGFAMGFAVIPTIFSITEDAIFSVPKHLTFGSLALGATLWQTLTRVVILTASPGIFSAVMIGLGRAVGETMIVLMATGNTPIMDFSMFQGMRTLAANIAVEMPEAEVFSTHYRVLFLAAFVLFMFTFVFNTFAEIVRQRLRVKYSSL